MYIHTYIHTYVYIYIYSEREIYIEREIDVHNTYTLVSLISLEGSSTIYFYYHSISIVITIIIRSSSRSSPRPCSMPGPVRCI